MNILVVEDNGIQRRLAGEVLSAAGHRVTSASAVPPALAAIKSGRPDIVLLDLRLPGVDGLELVRQLKADPATRDIPIVAVTSYQEEYTRTAVLAAGCDAFLLKPLSTRTLPDVMRLIARPEPDPIS